MAFFGGRSGNNPRFGRDTGAPLPPPNGFPYLPLPGTFYIPPHQPVFTMPFTGIGHPAAYVPPTAIQPTQPPVLNGALPAANLTNSTGGVGCEPGYNYFFPAEHTKIHVFETGDTPPWLLPPNFVFPFNAVHVPVNTTVGDLLKGFGACNADARKNRIFEVHQGGEGKWYKGMCLKGDDGAHMGKCIKDIGWDATRTGLQGGKPVVYLYITKG